MKNKPLSIIFIYTWLFCFGFLPFAMIVTTSFLSNDEAHLITLPFTLAHYLNLCSPLFIKLFFRSLGVALLTTLLCLIFAYPFSYLLVKSRLKSMLLLFIIIPFWTSSLVRTYALLSMLKFNGIVNMILLKLHLINEPLNLLYTNFAVVSGLVYNLFPFMVLPIFTNMERFDFRLIEAAKDLGANRFDLFFRVFLPNTKQGIISGCLLVLLPAMTLFYIPNILGGARSLMLGNLIQTEFLDISNWPQGAASSVILTLTLAIALILYQNQRQGSRK